MALMHPAAPESLAEPSADDFASRLRREAAAERRRAEWVRAVASDLPPLAASAAARHASAHELKSLVFDLQSEAFDR